MSKNDVNAENIARIKTRMANLALGVETPEESPKGKVLKALALAYFGIARGDITDVAPIFRTMFVRFYRANSLVEIANSVMESLGLRAYDTATSSVKTLPKLGKRIVLANNHDATGDFYRKVDEIPYGITYGVTSLHHPRHWDTETAQAAVIVLFEFAETAEVEGTTRTRTNLFTVLSSGQTLGQWLTEVLLNDEKAATDQEILTVHISRLPEVDQVKARTLAGIKDKTDE